MKKFYALLLAVLMFAGYAKAQLGDVDKVKKSFEFTDKDTVAWVYGGTSQVGINQGLLHNWNAGGEVASLTVNAVFSGFLARIYHNQIWSNNLDMAYSLFYAYSNHFVPRKNDDRIDFTSKYGFKINPKKPFYLTTLFNFRSQFTKGYDYTLPEWEQKPLSDFFSPAYFTLAEGVEFRKGTNLSLFLSPISARFTVAKSQYTDIPGGAFGIERGKTSRFELGAYFSGRYMTDVTKAITFKTRLDLYCNYLAKDKTDPLTGRVTHDNPGNIDVLWDNLFSWKLNKYFAVVAGLTLIYDNDFPYNPTYVDDNGVTQDKNQPVDVGWLQLRQVFTFGFEYKF
ncbi:DUF3078 domain-containing protein [Taibaiella soli]|nr:DUF3078 domain-containing protein [Taibaiella soli]